MKPAEKLSQRLVAIHQLHYLPWLRYFHKIAASDLFIVYDHAQFTKNDWQNRNKIKTAQGPLILTAPVQSKLGMSILEVPLSDQRFLRKHKKAIEINYRRAPYFKEIMELLEPFYQRNWNTLAELSFSMLMAFLEYLGIDTPVVRSSKLGVKGKGTEALVKMVKKVEGTAYLTGAYALKEYLNPEHFTKNGLDLYVQKWQCPVYPQQFPEVSFLSDLSILDLLFNCGKKSLDVLSSGGRIFRYAG